MLCSYFMILLNFTSYHFWEIPLTVLSGCEHRHRLFAFRSFGILSLQSGTSIKEASIGIVALNFLINLYVIVLNVAMDQCTLAIIVGIPSSPQPNSSSRSLSSRPPIHQATTAAHKSPSSGTMPLQPGAVLKSQRHGADAAN